MDANYKLVIVGLLLLALMPAIVLGSRGLKWGLMVWIGTLALGYRTFPIVPQLLVHPAEVVLYGLCLWLGIQRFSKRGSWQPAWVPSWIWLFALAWIWGWWPLVYGDAPWKTMLTEFKNVFLLLPLFLVVSVVVKDQKAWRHVALAFCAAGLWVACWGIIEYWYPNVKNILPNFITNPSRIREEGFQRAAFSFWGSPDAVYVCLLALPFTAFLWERCRGSVARGATIVSGFCLLYAVYISGHRNAWFIVALQLSFVLILKRRYTVFALVAVSFVVLAFYRLPDQTRTRLYSGTQLIAGKPVQDDSSGQGRWDRVVASVKRINEWPFGNGWAAATWVHNDFLQITENLGLPAGLFLLGVYLWTCRRMLSQILARSRLGDSSWLLVSMFLSHFAAGVVFATDANLQLTQHIAPVWFVWVSSQVLLKQMRVKEVSTVNDYSRLRALAYLQLRQARARHAGIS